MSESKEVDVRGRIESMVLKGLKNGGFSTVEDIPCSCTDLIPDKDFHDHLDFVLKRLEGEGRVTLTLVDGGVGVGGYTHIELKE